jgi:hypothetical protein
MNTKPEAKSSQFLKPETYKRIQVPGQTHYDVAARGASSPPIIVEGIQRFILLPHHLLATFSFLKR